ncbi:MAG: carboxypeptidase regulatory-like domain-containing protein [Acidobacteriota bacterium]
MYRILLAVLLLQPALFAATTGTITGTVKDPDAAALGGAQLTVTNSAMGIQSKAMTDDKGNYTFPSLQVGRYDLTVEAAGFKTQTRTGIVVDLDAVVRVDISLELAIRSESITVTETDIRVETDTTQMGEVVTGRSMTSVALNGRSFTDLLALQPGIVPVTTQEPDSIVMAGASVAIAPSGTLNPGNQSIAGQREDANGFMVNGGDVKELMNGGTSVVPNLDSIAEFRILTNNFDAEYGNYSGGIVNVVTKSGGNALHGSAFEFLRNTSLDSRSFFSPQRSVYRQNQFGGTIGGPIVKNKLFYFGDYQGTRQAQGVDTGLIPVPSLAARSGDLSGVANLLTGDVSGPFLAQQLSQRLGYAVKENEPYYTPGCISFLQCVFPNATIPQKAWAEPSKHLLPFIPLPNIGVDTFSTSARNKIVRDDKGSYRMDFNNDRLGLLTGYYYFDDYNLQNPYPTGQGGANVPGFGALNLGRSQLVSIGHTKAVSPLTVNEFRVSFMRTANNVGDPSEGVGPTLASQGFQNIVPLAPKIEGIMNVEFNAFHIGVPITNLTQANNTYNLSDNLSHIAGNHTLKAGFQASFSQVNVNPNPTANGAFTFFGSETGSDFADFLIGVASNYNQAAAQAFYGRHKYAGAFIEDTWRVRPNVTLTLGTRWELMQYWSEKYNQIPTFVLGQQSQVFTTAPAGLVYPTDKGVPNTLVPQGNRWAPRIGIAYAPTASGGWLGKLLGGPGKSSIRAGYGMFYSVIQGNTIAIDEPQPPYGLSYTSPAPPTFANPFVSASDGDTHVQPFPLNFPRLDASVKNPNTGIDFSPFLPQAGMTTPKNDNTYPYNENYYISVERQLAANTLLSLSYVGSQAHHLLLVYSTNPGDPALCLELSNPANVKPGTSTCGPFAEDATYIRANGEVVNGTRGPFGPNFSNNDFQGSIGNSSYNSFQASLRHSGGGLDMTVAYTYSKSMDQASSISDPVNPFNYKLTRALSAWDITHNIVTTYTYQLPLERLARRGNSVAKHLAQGWAISGITRISSGFPVTIAADGDNSLMGSIPNGVNNRSLDLPDIANGPLQLNGNPRNALPYFNTSLFTLNALGTPGTASRRSFHGPGTFNSDLALLRNFKFSETKALQFRFETFNTFNHTQFFGPSAVDGDFNSQFFGQVVKASPPRHVQLALKFTF